MEYVLADGQVVTASETENPDLFWAARGAGTCFGVATSFIYMAHDQKHPVWAAMLRFEDHQLPALIDYGNNFMEICNEKSLFLVAFTPVPNFGEAPSLIAILFYNGQEDVAKSFYDIPLQMESTVLKMGEIPYPAMNAYLNDSLGHGLRRSMKGSAFMFPLKLDTVKTLHEEFTEFVSDNKDAAMSTALIEYYPYKNLIKVQQTDTAFANRGAYGNLLYVMTWTEEKLDDVCRGKVSISPFLCR